MNERLLTCFLLGDMAFASAAGVVMCGAAIGALSMLLYGRLSPQTRVAQLSLQIAEARSALNRIDDFDVRAVWSMTRHAIGLSLQQIRLILVPTLCAASLVLGLAWLVDVVFDLSSLSFAPAWRLSWLCSGYLAFWLPLTVVAVAVKWTFEIK